MGVVWIMWCRKVRSQLSAYADGELTLVESRAVEEHLISCAPCAGELRELESVARAVRQIPEEDAPEDLHVRIMARVACAAPADAAARQAPASFWSGIPNPWMCVAVSGAAATVALGFLVSRLEASRWCDAPTVQVRSVDEQRPAAAPPREPAAEPRVTAGAAPGREAPAAAPRPAAPRTARADEPALQAAPEAEAVKPALRVARAAPKPKPAPARESRPEPEARTPDRPAEDRSADPQPVMPAAASGAAQPLVVAMPGEPVVNSTGGLPQPEPVAPAMEKDATRMAGMSMEKELPAEEDEGLRQLRMFFEERNRSIPQPPIPGDRRMRKL
jgi:hypothetical protein